MARRSKYDYSDPQFLLEVEGYARDGCTNEEVARNLVINPTYFSELQVRFPEISEALKRGRKPLNILAENSLYKRVQGMKVTTIKRSWIEDENGTVTGVRVEEITQEIPPDTGAIAFWLKQRKPGIWNKQPIKVDHTTGGDQIKPSTIIFTDGTKQ